MTLNISDLLITIDQSNIDMTKTQLSISLRERFDEIKRVFSLTEKELAEVLLLDSQDMLTSRTKWDSQISAKAFTDRIFSVVVLTMDWESYGYNVTNFSLHQPLVDGKSLLSLLSEKKLDNSLILFSGCRLTLLGAGETVLKDPFS